MIAKRIDRYISRAFLARFALSLLIISSLYLSFDALQRVDQIRRLSPDKAIPMVLTYYVYFFPARVLDTVPPLLLVGAGLALVQMSRNRELLTLKASGVSLQRITVPIFIWSLLVVIAVSWARESFVPFFTRRYEMLERELDTDVARNLVMKEPGRDRKLFVGSYEYATGLMSLVRVMDFYPGESRGTIKTIMAADSATWRKDGRISLENVTIQEFDELGMPQIKPPLKVLPTKLIETALVPFALANAEGEGLLPVLTIPELRRQARKNPDIPRFSVTLHSRFAATLMPFVLLLVGIPLLVGFSRAAESHVMAVVICAVVVGGLYVLSFVSISMGNTGTLDPALAGWLPVLLVGPVGVWLFASMRT